MSIIRESIRDILSSKLISALIAGTIAVTIFIICVFASIIYNMDALESRWSGDVRITVFPSDSTSVKPVMDEIKKIKTVNDVTYIDSESALEILRKRFPDEDIIFSSTVFPELIEVSVNRNDVESTKSELKKIKGVDDMVVNTFWFESLGKVISLIQYVSTAVMVLFFLMGLMLISYATRLGVLLRGSTELSLRFSHIISGLLLGVLGGAVGIAFYLFLNSILKGVMVHFLNQWHTGSLLQIAVVYGLALLMGICGNLFASVGSSDD